jgi:hypothetical protein
MRKTLLTISAIAALGAAALIGGRSYAAPVGNASALSGAAEELSLVDNVHCRRGWRHHRPHGWRRADGCRRGGVVIRGGSSRFVIRDGVRVRVGVGSRSNVRSSTRTTIRSKTTTRSGGEANIRSGGEVKGGGSVTTRGSGERSGQGSKSGGGAGGGSKQKQQPSEQTK